LGELQDMATNSEIIESLKEVYDPEIGINIVDDILDVDVDLVWSPLWHPSMMSDEAKDELGYDEELGMGIGYY
jgi:metal-sulfur cluster biosynthetic enzyme